MKSRTSQTEKEVRQGEKITQTLHADNRIHFMQARRAKVLYIEEEYLKNKRFANVMVPIANIPEELVLRINERLT